MRRLTMILTVSALALPAIIASAQSPAAARTALTLGDAKRVVAAAMEDVRRRGTGGVVAVVDGAGGLLCLERTENAQPAGVNLAIERARAARFRRPGGVGSGRDRQDRAGAGRGSSSVRGGAPILVDGRIAGGVGVSGAATAEQEGEIAAAGARVLDIAAMPKTGAGLPVTYFGNEAVAAAFAKGATLFEGADRNYTVMAGKREGPGIAELHTRNSDVFYILEGTATFVTGGTIPDPKNIAADEVRGSRIVGGQPRKLTKGDVILIPAGIPHWFQDVAPPFRYFVVKVR